MIPDGTLSSVPVPSALAFVPIREGLTDYEIGGVALQDASQGLRVKVWTVTYDADSGDVRISAPDVAATTLRNLPGLSYLSVAFDNSMNPALSYQDGSGSHLWWYDTTIPGYATLDYPTAVTPYITLDDNSPLSISNDDILLCYVRDGKLYYRQQRDRFTVEYWLADNVLALTQVAMGKNNRLQFGVGRVA